LIQAQLLILGCGEGSKADRSVADPSRQSERDRMVDHQIVARGIKDPAVIAAIRRIPRHLFVPDSYSRLAYADGPLPIGYGQTISQPYLIAFMTEAIRLQGDEKVLEIGTGSGYQAAVLAEIVPEVYTIEIIEPLAKRAAGRLAELGYNNVKVRAGDGYQGWPEEAPFDAILVTAAPDHVPQPLLDQLAVGGRLILPVGETFQNLILIRRTKDGFERSTLLPVRFVPMTRATENEAPGPGGR
jgi:protein-L-isoaspartate(D-aspartate) O-methyltransferase